MDANGNIGAALSPASAGEEVAVLLSSPTIRIERIVSCGQVSPPGFWYDQEWAEWVLVLEGAAVLSFEGDPALTRLQQGDYLAIPADRRHRVEWTDAERATVWLAIHYQD